MAADSCCPVLWYCVSGVVKSWPVSPTPPPAGYGRWYPTAAAALAVCGTSGSGSGGGGGGGSGAGGTISTSCCPGVLLPATLTGTFSAKTGGATAFPTSVAFVYGGGGWVAQFPGPLCGLSNPDLGLQCVNSGGGVYGWRLSSGAGVLAPFPQPAPTAAVCSPFLLVFDCTLTGGGCSPGSYRVTFTP